jgi:Ser/Thr protein kinase RdoA (MazF antagonist)
MTMAAAEDDEVPLSAEERRKLLQPNPSEEQVMQLLREHYASSSGGASIIIQRRLESYDDSNFQVQIDGTPYLLKIHNGVESENFLAECDGDFYKAGRMRSIIQFQNAILELCRENGLSTSVPQRPKSNTKSPVVVVSLPVISSQHSPCRLVVRLLSWTEGKPMSSIKLLPLEAIADAGRVLGRLDKVLDNFNENAISGALSKVRSSAALLGRRSSMATSSHQFPPPVERGLSRMQSEAIPSSSSWIVPPKPELSYVKSESQATALDKLRAEIGLRNPEDLLDKSLMVPARRYHEWDIKNTADLVKFVDYIDDEKRRSLVLSIIDSFKREMINSGVSRQFRQGVIHNDFNDANILVDIETMQVSGFIDFGDALERCVERVSWDAPLSLLVN